MNHIRKMRVFVGLSIVVIGVLVISFPFLKAAYYEYNKNKLLDSWEAGGFAGEMDLSLLSNEGMLQDNVLIEDENPKFSIEELLPYMEGIIYIPKIDLKSPILKGDTAKHLDVAICSTVNSPPMGAAGNYILAGHKSRIYGRHFNRLMEVAPSDIIELYDGTNIYTYEAYETLKVSADDTWILEPTEEPTATLITCDYTITPIGRFAVKLKLINISEAE